jgi:hypothetical protein
MAARRSLAAHDFRCMCTDKTNDKAMKHSPEKSVVKLNTGDKIKLNESGFHALFKAFFAEIETKFVSK